MSPIRKKAAVNMLMTTSSKSSFTLSIIVPILNEVKSLPRLLEQLLPYQRQGHEILIVDGGSDDGSANLVNTVGFKLISSEVGRARQMNAGAAAAKGDVLLFLHADTELPPAADLCIEQALAQSGRQWGRFDVRITGASWMFLVIATMMNWRSKFTGIATGDQAIFVRRSAFFEVGQFPHQALMEDIALSKALKKIGMPVCLRARVSTSGRRWEKHGIWSTIFLMWRLRWLYWLGRSPQELKKLYQ